MKLILLFILFSFAGIKAEASEWRCKAMPPKNTKYRNVIGAISIGHLPTDKGRGIVPNKK